MAELRVHRIPVDLCLDKTGLIDLILLQWHTSTPSEQTERKIPDGIVNERQALLDDLRAWLVDDFDATSDPRPLFIIAPEFSFPLSLADSAKRIVSALERPTVMIAGMEMLHWTEYVALLAELPDMPEPANWTQGGESGRLANVAGIWIGSGDQPVRSFIQPKRNPSRQEVARVFFGRDTLLFRSQDQNPGPRFNFCVQICSDFTSPKCVTELRERILDVQPPQPIDVTFVVQHNEDQDEKHFDNASREYFASGFRLAETQQGCLLFVNNANARLGKSTTWGRSNFRFDYQRVPRPPKPGEFATHTYWQDDHGADGHQRVVLREAGPGLYWFVYRPVYRYTCQPGEGALLPFSQEHAKFAPMHGTTFGYDNSVRFRRIPPVIHWLQCEWSEAVQELPAWVRNHTPSDGDDRRVDERQNQLTEAIAEEANESVSAWLQEFGEQDERASALMDWYCVCRVAKNLKVDAEPNRWHVKVSDGVKRLLRAYTLLHFGRAGFGSDGLEPAACRMRHAGNGTGLTVSFIWGAGELPAEQMITEFDSFLATPEIASMQGPRVLIVFVEPDCDPQRGQFGVTLKSLRSDLSDGELPPGAGQHLQVDGDAVRTPEPEIRWLCDSELVQQLIGASNAVALEQDLQNTIVTALNDG